MPEEQFYLFFLLLEKERKDKMDIPAYLDAVAKQQKTLVDEQIKLIQQQLEAEQKASSVSELALKREEYTKSILDFIIKNKVKIIIGGIAVLFLLFFIGRKS